MRAKLNAIFTLQRKAALVLTVLLATFAFTEKSIERQGDRFQIVLPLMAWGCTALNGRGFEYLGRYLVMFAGTHASKRALGDTAINQRPNGGIHGFPSGHTSTAAFGAAGVAQACVRSMPIVQGVAISAAVFTGASRVQTGWHDIWQVLAGGLWGWACAVVGAPGGQLRRRMAARRAGSP
ncbi:phosphatase PAP2 family protein [Aliiroseovarius subalbicans]|uniref:phosphatase PAP2 family protein n=1 Tax=Aliiroseovarius subalbicans TaxID=2925840 RepID=UPI001F57F178|nr:phosphatase PAP2 family protein [Aliiroseovarius subalbicans]MCI2400675.1 phosphatase PAP2 family protein [Aliiroseovarius subalbicans]